MRDVRMRFTVFASVLVGAVAIALPAQAGAFVSYYNCVNKPHDQWCDGRANGSFDGLHSWDWNEGWTPDGAIGVCVGSYRPGNGTWLASACDANNWIGRIYGNVTCACYEAQVKQQTGGARSVNGFAHAALGWC